MTDLQRIDNLILRDYRVDVKERTQNHTVSKFRNYFYLLSQKLTTFCEQEIAEYVGRDRTTVIAQTKAISEQIPYNPERRVEYTKLERKIKKEVSFTYKRVKRTRKQLKRDIKYHREMMDFFQKELESYPAHYSET